MAAPGSNLIAKETMSIPITRIGERFGPLRIVEPQAERAMLHSMQKYGQLTPVVTCRIVPGEHELLDGFKRLRAARQLGFCELTVRPSPLIQNDPFVLILNDPWDAQLVSQQC